MQTREKTLLIVFAVAALGNLMATVLPSAELNYLTKPLLLLSLLIAWQSANQPANSFSRLIAGAFLFSWFGDLLLMLVSSALLSGSPAAPMPSDTRLKPPAETQHMQGKG